MPEGVSIFVKNEIAGLRQFLPALQFLKLFIYSFFQFFDVFGCVLGHSLGFLILLWDAFGSKNMKKPMVFFMFLKRSFSAFRSCWRLSCFNLWHFFSRSVLNKGSKMGSKSGSPGIAKVDLCSIARRLSFFGSLHFCYFFVPILGSILGFNIASIVVLNLPILELWIWLCFLGGLDLLVCFCGVFFFHPEVL